MHIEQSTVAFPAGENPHPWPSGPWMIFGEDPDGPDEDDPARTDHPVPGRGRGDRGGRGSRGPDADRPDEDDPARTDHPVPGRKR